MKTGMKLLIGGIALVLIVFFMFKGTYNTAVSLQEKVKNSWGNVQSSYQRRADLIPGLIETVKGAAANEKDILTKVTEARAGISSAKDAISNATTPQELEAAGRQINSALTIAVEAYPQIRSTENFQIFQAQLEGTENRINLARDQYNGTVQEYNTHIRGLVTKMALNIFANGEFPVKESFNAAAGSDKAPEVKF